MFHIFQQVTVTFQVTGGTAIFGQDFLVTANQVTLKRGESSAPLPITIIDDNLPEPSETFTVSLGQVSGGGVLGTITQTNVVIYVSDDPNGAFGTKNNTLKMKKIRTLRKVAVITLKSEQHLFLFFASFGLRLLLFWSRILMKTVKTKCNMSTDFYVLVYIFDLKDLL